MSTENSQGPIICAAIARTRHRMVTMEIGEAARQGAKLIELRLDYLAKQPDFKRLLQNKPCPIIATVRRPVDGGRWSGTEDERMILIRQAIVSGFDYIDLETDIADKVRRFGNVKRIISYHNMREMPANLEEIHATMCKQDPDVVKIAVTAQEPADNLRILRLIRSSRVPTVGLCMGDLGTCSRVLSGLAGSPFTYTSFNRERSIAPGILTFADLKKIYFYEQIQPDTKVFGVIGDPIGHSLSPLLHNLAMRKVGFNGLYVPFRVPRGELADFLDAFQEIPVNGYSVTIPHKEAAARLAMQKSTDVEIMGAANTLLRSPQGFSAFNTDGMAAIDSLKANLPAAPDGTPGNLANRTVMILGAGGVARAIAHALARTGAGITITNRTEDRGKKLAEEVRCKFVDWAARHSFLCDTVINCTAVGMHPNLDESPIHHSYLRPNILVFDTIYTPENTMLIREAKARECHVLTGVDMFVRQAGHQFKMFTGMEPPLEYMSAVVRKALSPVNVKDEEP